MAEGTLSKSHLVFVFGPFTLDPDARRLVRGDKVVPLTAKAFDTLEALVESAGRTVTKDALLKQVWRDTFVQDDTLAQNISTIRRALGDAAETPKYVLTVPREGYRFVAPVEVGQGRPVVDVPVPVGEHAREHRSNATIQRRRWMVFYASGLASGLLLVLVAFGLRAALSRRRASDQLVPPLATFEVFEPEGAHFSSSGGAVALSPDGRYLAFIAADAAGRDQMWLRPLDSRESVRLPGTEDSSQPFWSADSRSIAFAAHGSLRRIAVPGGESVAICPLPGSVALAGSWSSQDMILFAVGGKGIFEVSASGGTARPVRIPNIETCADCLWPSFLPDGRRFLFTVASAAPNHGIYVGSLDGTPPIRIVEKVSSSTYTESGYLVYASGGALVARRFDAEHARVIGDPIPVADRVWTNPFTARAVFAVSQRGFLAYREPQATRLQWVTRNGSLASQSREAIHHSFTVGPDRRVLASELDPRLGTYDLAVYDTLWQRMNLTFNPGSELRPLWSEDGSAAVFAREQQGGWQLFQVRLDHPGDERPLLPQVSPDAVAPLSWNGDVLEYVTLRRGGPAQAWRIRPERKEARVLIADRAAQGADGRLSPDKKWLAHTINVEDSRVPHMAIHVRAWPNEAGETEVTRAGSVPRWKGDGSELFFIAPGGGLMAQHMDGGRIIGAAVPLFTTDALETSGLAGQAYDVAPDGRHFVVKVAARRPSIVVRSGWSTHLGR